MLLQYNYVVVMDRTNALKEEDGGRRTVRAHFGDLESTRWDCWQRSFGHSMYPSGGGMGGNYYNPLGGGMGGSRMATRSMTGHGGSFDSGPIRTATTVQRNREAFGCFSDHLCDLLLFSRSSDEDVSAFLQAFSSMHAQLKSVNQVTFTDVDAWFREHVPKVERSLTPSTALALVFVLGVMPAQSSSASGGGSGWSAWGWSNRQTAYAALLPHLVKHELWATEYYHNFADHWDRDSFGFLCTGLRTLLNKYQAQESSYLWMSVLPLLEILSVGVPSACVRCSLPLWCISLIGPSMCQSAFRLVCMCVCVSVCLCVYVCVCVCVLV
jgi:hypothetical protein